MTEGLCVTVAGKRADAGEAGLPCGAFCPQGEEDCLDMGATCV